MRILHIQTRLPDESGGGGANWPFVLACTQAAMGHEVETWGVLPNGPWLRRERRERWTINYECPIMVRPFHLSNPLSVRCLMRVLMSLRKPADVVHFHQYKILQYRWLIPLAKARRMKVCLTDLGGGGWRNLPVRTGARVDRFLLLSQYSARFFLRGHEDEFHTDHGQWPTDHNYPGSPERIVIVGGGVDNTFYVPRQGPPDSPPYLLFVGRVLPHKGIEYPIRALGLLHERYPSLRLKIAGAKGIAADYDTYLDKEVQRAGVEGRVEFLGFCNAPTQLRLYQGASLFVLPSTYRSFNGRLVYKAELFGLVLLEAMACGVPVICSRVGGMLEAVHDGETGLTFADQDAAGLAACVDRLLSDPPLRARLVENAQRMIKAEYTWRRVAEKCLAAYEQLLAH